MEKVTCSEHDYAWKIYPTDLFLDFAIFPRIYLFATVTFPCAVRSEVKRGLCSSTPSTHPKQKGHDKTNTKVIVAVPEVVMRSFRRVSHVCMCSATTDPEVYESVTL